MPGNTEAEGADMSDEPEPTTVGPSSPAALRDTRWLSGGIWAAVLVALLVSSRAGLGAGIGVFDFSTLSLIAYDGLERSDPNRELAASAALIFTLGIALALVVAWWAFARATQALVAALSDSTGEEDAPVPGIWLIEGKGRSPLSELATYLGIAWALIVLRPVVVTAIQVFTS